MKLTIQGRGVNINQRFEQYVQNKISRLERYLPGIEDARLNVSREGSKPEAPKSVELTVRRRRTLLRVEERDADMFAAFDGVLDKMYHRVARYKGRMLDNQRAGHEEDNELAMAEPLPIDSPELDMPRTLRIKTFAVVPMSNEEAIDQMELLGHDFYVFMSQEDGQVNVAYRRESGGYGILRPEK
jgi:putative sigma-54 modulation protein